MARFDVYPNPDKRESRHTPYVLDLQNDYLTNIETRVVAPLHSISYMTKPTERLLHTFEVEGATVVLHIAALASIPQSLLKNKVTSLQTEQYKIQEALDALFGAY